MDKIKLELLEGNYLEHFKFGKDLALVLPLKHPKRKRIEKHLNELSAEINKLKEKK